MWNDDEEYPRQFSMVQALQIAISPTNWRSLIIGLAMVGSSCIPTFADVQVPPYGPPKMVFTNTSPAVHKTRSRKPKKTRRKKSVRRTVVHQANTGYRIRPIAYPKTNFLSYGFRPRSEGQNITSDFSPSSKAISPSVRNMADRPIEASISKGEHKAELPVKSDSPAGKNKAELSGKLSAPAGKNKAEFPGKLSAPASENKAGFPDKLSAPAGENKAELPGKLSVPAGKNKAEPSASPPAKPSLASSVMEKMPRIQLPIFNGINFSISPVSMLMFTILAGFWFIMIFKGLTGPKRKGMRSRLTGEKPKTKKLKTKKQPD